MFNKYVRVYTQYFYVEDPAEQFVSFMSMHKNLFVVFISDAIVPFVYNVRFGLDLDYEALRSF